MLRVTHGNYYGKHANQVYMGSSQFKSFMQCPSMAMAEINKQYDYESDALLQGQYLDAMFERKQEQFENEHPEMWMKSGKALLKQFEKVRECYDVIKQDKKMFYLCNGKQQKIMTGEIAGVPFKIMIDSMHPGFTVDRKMMADFDMKWVNGEKVPWWKAWGYDIQAAIYAEIRRQNEGGELKPFELVAISKEKVPNKAWVRFTPETLEKILHEVIEVNAPVFQAIKDGLMDPSECGECDWCKMHKMLDEPEEV